MAAFINVIDQLPEGFLGSVAESDPDIRSAVCSEDLDAGVVVLRDSATGKHRKPATAAEVDLLEGVVVYNPTHEAGDSVTYPEGKTVPALRKGFIFAHGAEALTVHDPVFVVHSGADAGKLRNDSGRAAATPAVIDITETDANVDDGDYTVAFHLQVDGADGPQLEATVTASTTAHAALGAALKAAIEAVADVTVTVGAEASDVVGLSVAVDASTDVLAAFVVDQLDAPASGTTLATSTQGAEAPTAARSTRLRIDASSSAAGLVRTEVTR